MNEHTAVIVGGSGLIGTHLIEQMLKDDHFKILRALIRCELAFDHPKLQQAIGNFNDINDYTNKFGEGNIIFCSIGTTQKKVKNDRIAYEKIDHDIPVEAAQIGIIKGFKKFLIVSSVGANPSSSNFYLKLKGKQKKILNNFVLKVLAFSGHQCY